MALVLTCPHCETALTLPAAAPVRRILCPRCRRTLPHPEQQPDDDSPGEPVVAIVPDVVTWRQIVDQQFGVLVILGLAGVLLVWALIGVPLLRSDLHAGVVSCLLLAVPTLHLVAAHVGQEHRGPARELSQLIVLVFAFLGALALFGVGLYALMKTVGILL